MARLRIALAATNSNDMVQLQEYAASRAPRLKVVAAHIEENDGATLRILMKAKAERFVDGILVFRGGRPVLFS
jgi:hypothetical protein